MGSASADETSDDTASDTDEDAPTDTSSSGARSTPGIQSENGAPATPDSDLEVLRALDNFLDDIDTDLPTARERARARDHFDLENRELLVAVEGHAAVEREVLRADLPGIGGLVRRIAYDRNLTEAFVEAKSRGSADAGALYERKLKDEGVMGKLRPKGYEVARALGGGLGGVDAAELVADVVLAVGPHAGALAVLDAVLAGPVDALLPHLLVAVLVALAGGVLGLLAPGHGQRAEHEGEQGEERETGKSSGKRSLRHRELREARGAGAAASSQKDYPPGESVSTAQTRGIEPDLVTLAVNADDLAMRGRVGALAGLDDIGARRRQGGPQRRGPRRADRRRRARLPHLHLKPGRPNGELELRSEG